MTQMRTPRCAALRLPDDSAAQQYRMCKAPAYYLLHDDQAPMCDWCTRLHPRTCLLGVLRVGTKAFVGKMVARAAF